MFSLALAFQAQAISLSLPNDLILTVSPTSPKAGENITASAKSFAFDAARAKFTWFLNGKQTASGVGLVEQTFAAGRFGSEINVRVTVISEDGNFYEAETNISVADIDFIIHSLTYTPSFYRGAALPTPGSVVEVIATPHLFRSGERLRPQNLIYEWSLDDKTVASQSVGGKNKLALKLADVGLSS